MAATGLVYGEGCWGWGEIVIVLEARTAAKGKVMTRLLSGVEWLGGRRRALVRYVSTSKRVQMVYEFYAYALASPLDVVHRKCHIYTAGNSVYTNIWLYAVCTMGCFTRTPTLDRDIKHQT